MSKRGRGANGSVRAAWLESILAAAFGLASLDGCAERAPLSGGAAASARAAVVRNAIAFGPTATVFFGVQSVDGVAVHAKFDRDEEVAVEPGARRLRLRYYAQNLMSAPAGEEECTLAFEAAPGGVYGVEGMARDGRWRARLIDERGAPVGDCLFADGTTWGVVLGGGAREVAVRAAPPPRREAAPPSAVPAVVAAPPPSAASGAAAAPPPPAIPPAGAVAAESAVPTGDPVPSAVAVSAGGSAPRASGAAAAAAPAAGGGDGLGGRALSAVRSALTGNVDEGWGCGAGYLRAKTLDSDGIVELKGSDHVRLLGVDVVDTKGVDLSEACVRLAFDDGPAVDGQRDREGRLLAFVFLPDGTFVNEALLRMGQARAATRWRHRYLGEFLAAQSEARTAKRGIWATP